MGGKFGFKDTQFKSDYNSLNSLILKDARLYSAVESANNDFRDAYSSSNASNLNRYNKYIYEACYTKNCNYSSYLQYSMKTYNAYKATTSRDIQKVNDTKVKS